MQRQRLQGRARVVAPAPRHNNKRCTMYPPICAERACTVSVVQVQSLGGVLRQPTAGIAFAALPLWAESCCGPALPELLAAHTLPPRLAHTCALAGRPALSALIPPSRYRQRVCNFSSAPRMHPCALLPLAHGLLSGCGCLLISLPWFSLFVTLNSPAVLCLPYVHLRAVLNNFHHCIAPLVGSLSSHSC